MGELEYLSEEEIDNLFNTQEDTSSEKEEGTESTDENDSGNQGEENDRQETTETQIDVDNLFSNESESGSSNTEEEGKTTEVESGSSNFYSSIATALKTDGVFPDLEDTESITDAEKFTDMIKNQVKQQLDETNKRIYDALNNGISPNEIQFYENTIKQLNSIKEEFVDDEKNEDFRKKLILQDFINKGYTEEEANEELQEILDNGSDVKKAKRALNNLKNFYSSKYDTLIKDAEREAKEIENKNKEQLEKFKKDFMEKDKIFGDIEISKDIRQKALDAVIKPVYKDKETGKFSTAIQQYEKEHKEEFLRITGLVYALTNGFKDFGNIFKSAVNKEKNKAMQELESKLSNTRRTSSGNLDFAEKNNDTESIFKNYSLDI